MDSRLIFVNIGSNLGDRRMNISRAVRRIGQHYGTFELSHIVESQPWGFESPNAFLNIAMVFRSDESPLTILHTLQEIEKTTATDALRASGKGSATDTHRDANGNYADRYIDIDIMTIEGVEMNTPELTLPHPHLRERPFFMEPLQELLDQLPS